MLVTALCESWTGSPNDSRVLHRCYSHLPQGLNAEDKFRIVRNDQRDFKLYYRHLLRLCYDIIPQVQSEMLKKWKRWKLGKDIDEEYRNTYSQTPHIKTGSIATGNLPYLHENNASDQIGDSPRLSKTKRESSCSAAPEENRQLVVSYSNGKERDKPAKSRRHTLQFSFLLHRSAASQVSTTTEDVCLEEKAQCRTYCTKGEETNV